MPIVATFCVLENTICDETRDQTQKKCILKPKFEKLSHPLGELKVKPLFKP